MPPRVALVKGDERYSNIKQALKLIEDDIRLGEARRVLLKPNLLSVTNQLAATNVDAVRAVLDFLEQRTQAKITIGEGSGTGSSGAMVGFKNFGYFDLAKRYKVDFVDLNIDQPVTTQILDSKLKPVTIRLAKTVVDADYRISVCPPKTHDCVIVTASLKNLVMGSIRRRQSWPVRQIFALGDRLTTGFRPLSGAVPTWLGTISGSDKIKMHQGYPVMNLNLYKVAKVIPPHLSVIDGFQGMEGNGPAEGDEVDFRIALASTDFVAADSLVARLMGFDPGEIGYLVYCHRAGFGEMDISKMNIIGERVEACARTFKPHPAYEEQLKWHIAEPERYLE